MRKHADKKIGRVQFQLPNTVTLPNTANDQTKRSSELVPGHAGQLEFVQSSPRFVQIVRQDILGLWGGPREGGTSLAYLCKSNK